MDPFIYFAYRKAKGTRKLGKRQEGVCLLKVKRLKKRCSSYGFEKRVKGKREKSKRGRACVTKREYDDDFCFCKTHFSFSFTKRYKVVAKNKSIKSGTPKSCIKLS